ncbi:MAG TPA: hypothetical protein VGI74_07060 [Streptosporangiaceae bacterium]
MAVGRYALSPEGSNILTLAELWTSSGWQVLDTRFPSSDDHLGGVSCWAASDCIAVGGDRGFGGSHLPLAESWSGGPWVTMTTPSLGATDYNTMFDSVSCTSANWCMAVGVYDNTSHDTFTLTEIWNGKQWAKVTAPGTGLASVSCTSPSSCLAVSSSTVQHWNGTAWSVILTIQPPPGAPGFSSVKCLSASDCLLVGGNGTAPLVERWDGSTFHQQPVPGSAPGSQLTDAACTAAAHCVAVGGSPSDFQLYAMAAYWGGKTWRVSRMGRIDALDSVACPAISGCMAVGDYLDQGDAQVPLAEQEQQGALQHVTPEPPSAGATGLGSVSCVSVTDCMAVNGQVGDRWNGKSWQTTQLPIGAGSVACAAATACLAVGGHQSAALWNGNSWKALAPLKPKHSHAALFNGVSCASPRWCMAVGQYFVDPHESFGINLIEVWNGTAWQQLKLPGPGQNNSLTSVSCTSVGHCMVVGSFNSTDGFDSFADLWNGRTWRKFTVAGPDRFLASLSCSAATHCMAAGFHSVLTSSSSSGPIAESWNGGSWQKVPVSIGAGLFNSLSCTQPDACVAVGQRDDGQVLAARWNGAHWSAMPAANP